MSKTNNIGIPVQASSGNIFADFGQPDTEDAFASVKLAQQIAQIIEQKELSQTETGKFMGLDQSKVSAFSTDRLLRCFIRLG